MKKIVTFGEIMLRLKSPEHERLFQSPRLEALFGGGEANVATSLALLGAEEIALVRLAAQFPRVVESAAAAREPHRVAFFLYDLAAGFHAYWNVGNDRPDKRFIVAQDAALTSARLFLASQIGQVVKNGLAILGVEAAEEL